MTITAVLALEDGTIFSGQSIGAKGNTTGEVVFNTALTGYQEILTDPSYSRQIVTLTYPHIGNTGTTPEDLESPAAYAAGLVVRDVPPVASNWRKSEDLREFLSRHKVVAISGHRHPQADAHPAREGRPGRLHHGRRQDRCRRGRAAREEVSRPQGHGPGQGGHHQAPVPVERRQHLAAREPPGDARAPAPARGGLRLRREAQHPAHARGPRLPHDRGAGPDHCRRSARARAGWRVPVERPR